jgi:hypothetical protein
MLNSCVEFLTGIFGGDTDVPFSLHVTTRSINIPGIDRVLSLSRQRSLSDSLRKIKPVISPPEILLKHIRQHFTDVCKQTAPESILSAQLIDRRTRNVSLLRSR